MDNMEEMSDDQDNCGQDTSWRVDHDNSISHFNNPVQPSQDQTNEDTRRLVDGGPLSNHLIDLERQQIHQAQNAFQLQQQQPQVKSSTLFSGNGINQQINRQMIDCLETSLEEGQQMQHRNSMGAMINQNRPRIQQELSNRAGSNDVFDPQANFLEPEEIPTTNMIDWHTEVISGRMVQSNQVESELQWDPQSLDPAEQSQNRENQRSHKFSFYPSQPNFREMQTETELHLKTLGQMTTTFNQDSTEQSQQDGQPLLTARTSINNQQSYCFEPCFEHEEVQEIQATSLVFSERSSSSRNSSTQPQSYQHERLMSSPKVGGSMVKIDINEGPQDTIMNEQNQEGELEEWASPQYRNQRLVSSTQGGIVPLQSPRDNQGGIVPIQPMLTLEDAAEAQNSKNPTGFHLAAGGNLQDIEDDVQIAPAEHTDNLYDSDEGVLQQSQNQRLNSISESKSPRLRASMPIQSLSQNNVYFGGKYSNQTMRSDNQKYDSSRASIPISNSNIDENSLRLTNHHRNTQHQQHTHSSQPNLLFQPFQRIQSLNDIHADSGRLSSYRESSTGAVNYNKSSSNHSPKESAPRVTDELRDSTTTQVTQMIRNQNYNAIAITQEANSHNTPTDKTPEEQKVAHSMINNQQPLSQFIATEESKRMNQPTEIGNSPSFPIPDPTQLKSYEKMVAQIIRDSIEKENRALKQQIKQLQLNEQKRNHLRNPFQPKNPKIFSKPNFAVSKSLSGRNSAFKYRPSGPNQFSFQQTNRNQFQSSANQQAIVNNSQKEARVQQPQYSKKDESFEGSEVIEELIEIEESGDEYSNYENNSMTVKTNIAGGRGSIGSIIDDYTSNDYNEEIKNNGGRKSPHTVLSQRFADHQSFYGFRRDFSRMQSQNQAGASSMSQAPGNQELEYEDLEALFNYQAENLTENDESEQPFYVPSCMDDRRIDYQNGSELYQHKQNKHRQETLTQINRSPRNDKRSDNQSIDAIYSSTAFDLVKTAGSEKGNHKRRRSFDSYGIEETKGEIQTQMNEANTNNEQPRELLRREKQTSESPQRRENHARITAQKDFGNIEDDDIVNQNSSHDGRSQQTRSILQRMDIDLTQSTLVNEQQTSQQAQVASFLLQQDLKKSKQVEKSTQMSNAIRSRKSSNSSIKKLDGPQRFTYFSAQSLADDRWICPICLDVFEDAVETPCCHNLFCEKCIKNTRSCPLCNNRIIGALKPNIPIRRLVMELSVQCPNENCKCKIKRCDVERHLDMCQYTLVECPNNQQVCGLILRKDLQKHSQDECEFRQVACLLNCGINLVLNQMDEHIANECTKAELDCANNCGKIVERGHMEEHLKTECPQQIVNCPNKGESLFEDGCNAGLRRHELEQHRLGCVYRRIMCPNDKCASVIMFKNLETHDERCLFKIVECDNRCGTRTLRQNMQQHKEACEYQLIRCPYYDLGCKIEILRKDYREHLIEENFNHSIIFIEGQKKKNQQIDDLNTEIQSLRKDYDSEMQWMYVEMRMMKEQMKKLLGKKESSSGDNPLEHQNSSFGENIASFQRRAVVAEESKQGHPMQHQYLFARGAQGDVNANNQHFGGTRYNNPGANSMSVASVSVAINRQSNQFPNPNNDRLNQGQQIDISDELEPRAAPLRSQNNSMIDPRNRSGAFVQPNEILRPNTRRGRNDIMTIQSQSQNQQKLITGLRHPQNFDEAYDANSVDYTVDRQNSLPNSRDHFNNDNRHGNAIQGLSALNPLCGIDGARNPNDSENRGRNTEENRQPLSGVVNHAKEPNSNSFHNQNWLQNRNSKPPLFRHQMMLRASEPDYSASQNNSSQGLPQIAAAQSLVSNPLHDQLQHSFSRNDNVTRIANINHESSERKNPLAYLLASANASVDSTTQAAVQQSHPNLRNNNLVSKQFEKDSNQRLQTFFQEEPIIEDDLQGERAIEMLMNSQVNADDSVLNMLDRFSSMQKEENKDSLSTAQKQQVLQQLTTSYEERQQQAANQEQRRYRQLQANGALPQCQIVQPTSGIRQHRIRVIKGPKRLNYVANANGGSGMQKPAITLSQATLAINHINNNVMVNKNDLDGSNVLYDEDFEIEEENKVNTSGAYHVNEDNSSQHTDQNFQNVQTIAAAASSLFNDDNSGP